MPTPTSTIALLSALQELNSVISDQAPFVAKSLHAWMCRISPTAKPEGHFEHARMFPILQLPNWVAEGLGVATDSEFHRVATYSSICGYYYTRLVDNFMDVDVEPGGTGLLPATAILASEFQFAYQRYFPAQHEFWRHFRAIWQQAAESTAHDAVLQVVSSDDFECISSRKFAAAAIPVAATCYFYDRPEAVAGWVRFTHALGHWSQMFDDILDWHVDRQQGRATWFLSEGARRKCVSESLERWVAREGCGWGFAQLDAWMRDLQLQAQQLRSPAALDFLQHRERLQRQKEQHWKEAFAALADLAGILQPEISPNLLEKG